MNHFVAQRLFDELQQAELAYQLRKVPHHVYLKSRRHRYQGAARKELERIIALGPEAKTFTDFFLKEFDT